MPGLTDCLTDWSSNIYRRILVDSDQSRFMTIQLRINHQPRFYQRGCEPISTTLDMHG